MVDAGSTGGTAGGSALNRRDFCYLASMRFFDRNGVLGVIAMLGVVTLSGRGALGQHGPYQSEIGDYTVIYSVVRSDTLPVEEASRHGLPADPNAVLVNVTVQRGGENVTAQMNAIVTNLAEQQREIEMRESVANDLVSYIGVVEIADREVLDFTIDILPEGTDAPFRLEFRETFLPQPRDAAPR